MGLCNNLPKVIKRIAGMAIALAVLTIPSFAYGEEIQTPVPEVALTQVNVSLTENYNQDYALYEESLQGAYYLYSNVYNGEITSNPVTIDIPVNLTFSLEKDGIVTPYTPNTQLTQLGNYVLRVSMIEGNINYASTFRFSIREPKPVTEEVVPPVVEAETSPTEGTTEGEQIEEPITAEYEVWSKWTSGPLFLSNYTYEVGNYAYCLIGNEVMIQSNVPNGIITNSKVRLTIPEGVEYTVYRNDVEYDNVSEFTTEGSYRVEFSNSSSQFVSIYKGLIPTFQFRIVTSPVKDMRYYNLPKGFVFTQISVNGKAVDITALDQFEYYALDEDGDYSFTFMSVTTNEAYSANISRDTQGPKFGLTIDNQKATISFVTTDQAKTILYKDGALVSEGMLTSVAGKGQYYYEAYDYAGNMSSMHFSLGKSINAGTIWSIIFVLLLIGGVIYVVKSSKTNLHVR